MTWSLTLLQCVYPLLLLLSSGIRPSFPSLLYLLALFVYLTWTPIRRIATKTKKSTPTFPTISSISNSLLTTPAASDSIRLPKLQSSSISDSTVIPAASARVHVWIVNRAFFVLLTCISLAMIVAHSVLHSLYWSNAWQPDGLSDGQSLFQTNGTESNIVQVLQAFSLAPWPSAKEGLQSLLPDLTVFVISAFMCRVDRLTFDGHVEWETGGSASAQDWKHDELSSSFSAFAASPSAALLTSSPSAVFAATMQSSSSALILNGVFGTFLFFSAILQPSLLSLPYFLLLCFIMLKYVFGNTSNMNSSRCTLIPVWLKTLYGYLMLHLIMLHLNQWNIIQSHIDTDNTSHELLGRFGLFVVDTSFSDGVCFLQWISLICLSGLLISIALQRQLLRDYESMPTARERIITFPAGEMSSPVATDSLVRPGQQLVGDHERKSSSEFLAPPSASTLPRSNSASSHSHRSWFVQSSFEFKSFLQRSFRNHGLLLIFALSFVQIMMVQDLFNVINVAILLICMNHTNDIKGRGYLFFLLRFEILFLVVSSVLKYFWFIPFLISNDLNSPEYDSKQTLLQTWGLEKHIDGFTAEEDRTGSYVFLYLLDSIGPIFLIVIYFLVHQEQESSDHLTVDVLFNAVNNGDTTQLQKFTTSAPEMITVKDRYHRTLLHIAAKNGHLATTRILLALDIIDVNVQDRNGNTALHYAYMYGYDSIVHLLLATQPSSPHDASSTSIPINPAKSVVDPEITNKAGHKASEIKQSWWTRAKKSIRNVFLVFERFFFLNASKLALLLLYFVACQSVNILHMFYFMFFLLFFSVESLARKLWKLLVQYCAFVFFVLYTFSVVEPLYSYNTDHVNQGTDWIRYVGLFAVRDSGSNDIAKWFSKLAIYYSVYVLVLIQKMVYQRGEELGMLDQKADKADEANATTFQTAGPRVRASNSDDLSRLDEELRQRQLNKPSRFYRITIMLLTYGTLLGVAMIDVSLFHLGYMCIFLLALCIHQFSSHAGRLLSGLWFLCVIYCSGVLFLMYAYLLTDFRSWLKDHLNWSRFSLYDIGFRAPSEDSDGSSTAELSSDSILLILLPPTGCFVMCGYYLRTVWRDVKAKEADVKQRQLWESKARAPFHVQSPASSAYQSLGDEQEQKGDYQSIRVEPSPNPVGAAPSMMNFHLLSKAQVNKLKTSVSSLYTFFLNMLARHSTQLLTIFILIRVLYIDDFSIVHAFYLLIVLIWLPLDGRSLSNSLWLPISFYSIPLILAKYMFQFPGLVSEDTIYPWIGLEDFNGDIIRNLIGDFAILLLATMSRVANRTKVKAEQYQKDQDDENALLQSPLPEDRKTNAADVEEEKQDATAPSNGPTLWNYFTASCRVYLSNGIRVTSYFFESYGLELFLLFFLLMAFARSNVLSLVYVLVYATLWMYGGGRSIWIRSAFVYFSILVVLAVSILWQYFILLGMPPSWKQDHTYRWKDWDGLVQQFLLVDHFQQNDLVWDCISFVILAWFIPYWRQERSNLGDKGQSPPSGSDTPKLKQSLLTQEERRSIEADDVAANGQMYVPPSFSKAERKSDPNEPLEVETTHWSHLAAFSSSNPASSTKFIQKLWSNSCFYTSLLLDKAIFLIVFFIGTSHNNLFACIYLVFSCWYLLQNYLFDHQLETFINMWKRLRAWNFFILVVFIIYQLPWVPSTFMSDANLRWEMTLGFHKFIMPPSDSKYFTATYFRVWTDPLGGRGAVPQIFIFLLIEIQLLVLQSHYFRDVLMAYYKDIQTLSEFRRDRSVASYQEWLLHRIESIIGFRAQIESNFSYVFVEASKFNEDYFQDEMVWPQPKPPNWDQQVQDLLLEDSLKRKQHLERQASLRETNPKLAAKVASERPEGIAGSNAQTSPSTAPNATPSDSELGDSHRLPVSSVGAAFADAPELGPMQHAPPSAGGEDDSDSSSPEGQPRPATVSPTKGQTVAEVEEAAAKRESPSSGTEKKPGKFRRFLLWLRRPLLSSIDHAFWTEFAYDPSSKRWMLSSVPNPKQLDFVQAVWRFLLSNTQWICFILYFINLLMNGNVMSMVVPIGILCYAIFERTRVGPGFWLFCMLYSSIIVSLKFIFQLYIFCVTLGDATAANVAGAVQVNRNYIFAPSPSCVTASPSDSYSTDAIFGLRKFNTHTYFTIVLIDMACMLSIMMHRTIMLSRGMWYLNEEEEIARQQREKVQEKLKQQRTSPPIDIAEVDSAIAKRKSPPIEEPKSKGIFSRLRKLCVHLWRKLVPLEIQWYYKTIMPAERADAVNPFHPGYDFYIFIFLVQLFSAIWILICYDYMASTSLNTVASSLSTNLFSGNMVLTLFLQILIIILDRVCYLYRSILGKLIMQYVTVAFWFSKMFLDWPVVSQNGFTNNSFAQFFFVLQLLYFVFSGLQIYTGYPPTENTGFQLLTRYPGVVMVWFYKIYRALPFVFELRTMLDWMCSTSSLDLFDTLKLEEIHGSLYLTQCDIIYRKKHDRGTPRDLLEKFCTGTLLFILLLCVIFGPLLLFSTANPVSQDNPVVSTSLTLSLMGQQGEYPLIAISSYVLSQISSDYYVQLKNEDLVEESDRIESIQQITLAPFSDDVWSISPPALNYLTSNLNDPLRPMSLKVEYSFTRAAGAANVRTIGNQLTVGLTQTVQSQLAKILNQTQTANTYSSSHSSNWQRESKKRSANYVELNESNEAARNSHVHAFHYNRDRVEHDRAEHMDLHQRSVSDTPSASVLIPQVIPMFLRLPASTDPIELNDPTNRTDITLALDIAHEGYGTPIVRWWFVNETIGDTQSNIQFITVSNRIFAGPLSNLSYSIVAVYVTILFTIGQFVRLCFGNQVTRIPVEDLPNANKLVQIVEGIYIARQKRELAKEEILYRRLLKIYRTPSLLLVLTARQDSPEEIKRAKGDQDKPGTYARRRYETNDNHETADPATLNAS